MLLRDLLLRHRILRLPSGGGRNGGCGGGIRTLTDATFYQQHRPPSPAAPPPPPPPPPPYHSVLRTSPPFLSRLRGSTASATWPPSSPSPPPPPRPYNPMAAYLARACGFSFEEAAAAAELLSGNKSPRNPNPSSSALSEKSPLETQIGWLVSSAPPPLGGKTGAKGDVGFSGRTLAQLMLLDPDGLTGADAARKVGFWCALFRAEADLLRALESNARTPGSSPKDTAVRKMILLLECGVPNRELRAILRKDHEDVARSVDSLEALIKRVEELGLARGRQAAYGYALRAIAALSMRKLEAKLGEHRAPQAVGNAAFGFPKGSPRKNAGKAADMPSSGEDGTEASSAAAPSIPLTLSLEKKVMPPYYVLQILRSNKDYPGENRASYLLRMCKKARFWTNSHADVNREFQSFMKLLSLLVRGRIAA